MKNKRVGDNKVRIQWYDEGGRKREGRGRTKGRRREGRDKVRWVGERRKGEKRLKIKCDDEERRESTEEEREGKEGGNKVGAVGRGGRERDMGERKMTIK